MRFHERTRRLHFKKGVKRADKSNAIDLLCNSVAQSGTSSIQPAVHARVLKCTDLGMLSDIEKEDFNSKFEEIPEPFTSKERDEWYVPP